HHPCVGASAETRARVQLVHPRVVGSWERGLQAAPAGTSEGLWNVQPKPGIERHRSAVNGARRDAREGSTPLTIDRACSCIPTRILRWSPAENSHEKEAASLHGPNACFVRGRPL